MAERKLWPGAALLTKWALCSTEESYLSPLPQRPVRGFFDQTEALSQRRPVDPLQAAQVIRFDLIVLGGRIVFAHHHVARVTEELAVRRTNRVAECVVVSGRCDSSPRRMPIQ